jgi:hypothetical protein
MKLPGSLLYTPTMIRCNKGEIDLKRVSTSFNTLEMLSGLSSPLSANSIVSALSANAVSVIRLAQLPWMLEKMLMVSSETVTSPGS